MYHPLTVSWLWHVCLLATVFIPQLGILWPKCLCTDVVTFLEEISRRYVSAKRMCHVVQWESYWVWEPGQPGFESQLPHLLVGWPWVSHLSSSDSCGMGVKIEFIELYRMKWSYHAECFKQCMARGKPLIKGSFKEINFKLDKSTTHYYESYLYSYCFDV